ncbi:MAG: amidohydrolase family protein [Pseudomonadales bacterium]
MARFDYPGGERESWLERVAEPALEPDLPIVDAHHHLWVRDGTPYLLRELAGDLHAGHRIVATVFVECHAMYRPTGPEAMKPVGEMAFIAGIGAMSDAGAFAVANVCRGAVANADLTLGDGVLPVLDALETAADGRLRGIRASVCWDADPRMHRTVPQARVLGETSVRRALSHLERRGLSLDCWLYHTQLSDLVAVADALPNLTIVLNHTGTPILGGPYRDQQEAVRRSWLHGMAELARRPNVVVKLGALPARFDGPNRAAGLPPTSEDVTRAWTPWILPCLELFGARRCLFESNFPVHKNWLAYGVLWNAFKRMAAAATMEEKQALFAGTATRIYRLGNIP